MPKPHCLTAKPASIGLLCHNPYHAWTQRHKEVESAFLDTQSIHVALRGAQCITAATCIFRPPSAPSTDALLTITLRHGRRACRPSSKLSAPACTSAQYSPRLRPAAALALAPAAGSSAARRAAAAWRRRSAPPGCGHSAMKCALPSASSADHHRHLARVLRARRSPRQGLRTVDPGHIQSAKGMLRGPPGPCQCWRHNEL